MTVTAPYNFVPLSNWVCEASELGLGSDLPSQDDPETGGISGEVRYTLTAKSPLLVAGESKETDAQGRTIRKFHRAPDGSYIIPGSSLRGMIRNVLEIASFDKMQFVEDRRFGMRDLSPAAAVDYRSKFTARVRPTGYISLSKAGYLQYVEGKLLLYPCDYARLDHNDIIKLSNDLNFEADLESSIISKKEVERSAKTIQSLFLEPLVQKLWVDDTITLYRHSSSLAYKRASVERNQCKSSNPIEATGEIVFTGHPGMSNAMKQKSRGSRSGVKHMEFFFYDRKNSGVPVIDEVWKMFLDVHEHQESASPTWLWRKADLDQGSRIPVFWLENEDGSINQIGLSMMFKLAGQNSTRDMIDNTNPAHSGDSIDLATCMFGRIGHKGMGSFRGRLSFGVSTCDNQDQVEELSETAILATPKPSFFPSYVRQKDVAAASENQLYNWEEEPNDPNKKPRRFFAQYRSYMNWEGENGDVVSDEIRGWKRYPARGDGRHKAPTLNPVLLNEKTCSVLHPLLNDEGLCFSGTIRFHNLHEIELGALLWALSWGQNPELRHSLGMGKSLGWGQVSININKALVGHPDLELDAGNYITVFTKAMDTGANKKLNSSWADTPQIKSLTAMANPRIGRNENLTQMELDPDPDARRNDFSKSKSNGGILADFGIKPAEIGIKQAKPGQMIKTNNRRHNKTVSLQETQAIAANAGLFRQGEKVRAAKTGLIGAVLYDQKQPLDRVDVWLEGKPQKINASELERS